MFLGVLCACACALLCGTCETFFFSKIMGRRYGNVGGRRIKDAMRVTHRSRRTQRTILRMNGTQTIYNRFAYVAYLYRQIPHTWTSRSHVSCFYLNVTGNFQPICKQNFAMLLKALQLIWGTAASIKYQYKSAI